MFRGVGLGLFIVEGGNKRRFIQDLPALSTEFELGRVDGVAPGANSFQSGAAFPAEFGPFRMFSPTNWALHNSLSDEKANKVQSKAIPQSDSSLTPLENYLRIKWKYNRGGLFCRP